MSEPPRNSHMQLELLVSLNYLSPDSQGAQQLQSFLTTWGTIAMVTYAKLKPDANEEAVEAQLTKLLAERSVMKTFSATLQPLKDAHLGSSDVLFDDFNRDKGDARQIAMLSSVAAFLLLIAAVNFINLATARASLRAKEVGVRKSAGATRPQLIRQFLQESFFVVGIAAAVGLVMLRVLESVVGLPLGEGFLSYLLGHPRVVLASVFGIVLLALLAGAYPAFVLPLPSPMRMLSGKFAHSSQGLWLCRILVVLQFAISIAIIIGMLVVYQQLQFMKNKNPGFQRDGIVNLTLNDNALVANYTVLKDRLLAAPHVVSVAGSSNMPGSTFGRTGVRLLGAGSEDFYIMSALSMDGAYLDTLSMKLVAGRNYSPQIGTDRTESIILNESAVRALGWADRGSGRQGPRDRGSRSTADRRRRGGRLSFRGHAAPRRARDSFLSGGRATECSRSESTRTRPERRLTASPRHGGTSTPLSRSATSSSPTNTSSCSRTTRSFPRFSSGSRSSRSSSRVLACTDFLRSARIGRRKRSVSARCSAPAPALC